MQELWERLNQQRDWGFTWGSSNIEDVRKAVQTITKDSEGWMSSTSPAFPVAPLQMVESGNVDPIYIAVYRISTGEMA